MSNDFDNIANQMAQLDFRKGRTPAPRVHKKIGQNIIQATGLSDNQIHQALVFVGDIQLVSQQFDGTRYRRQGIPYFMGDGRRKFAHGRHFVGRPHFFLQLLGVGQVLKDCDDSSDLPVGVEQQGG